MIWGELDPHLSTIMKFSMMKRTTDSIVCAKFGKNRSSDAPLSGKFIPTFQILMILGGFSPHFYTSCSGKMWLKGADLGSGVADRPLAVLCGCQNCRLSDSGDYGVYRITYGNAFIFKR